MYLLLGSRPDKSNSWSFPFALNESEIEFHGKGQNVIVNDCKGFYFNFCLRYRFKSDRCKL